jgi:Transposase DDE domain group 1
MSTSAFVTDTAAGALQWLQARHRAHARVEDRIRCAKDTGLRRIPSREFAINQAWCIAAAIAADLIAWPQIHALDGDLAKAEPKRLRYRLLHTPPASPAGNAAAGRASPPAGPGPTRSAPHSVGSRRSPRRADQLSPYPPTGGPGDHAHRRDRRPITTPRHTLNRQTSIRTAGPTRQARRANHRGWARKVSVEVDKTGTCRIRQE